MFSLSGICYRIWITVLNILFPPLAVMLLAGPGYDCLMNCLLFLLAVLPSHIHGFYVSCVYFHRRHKVREGQYPGGPKTFIESKNVLNGGASQREVERLYWKEKGGGPARSFSRKRSRSRGHATEMGQHRREGSSPGGRSNMGRSPSVRSTASRRVGPPPAMYDQRVARDGYGPPPPPHSDDGRRWYA